MRVEATQSQSVCSSSASHARQCSSSSRIRVQCRLTTNRVPSIAQPQRALVVERSHEGKSQRRRTWRRDIRVTVVEVDTEAATTSSGNSGSNLDLLWHGQPFFVGANIPWKNYGVDFQDGVYIRDWWWGYRFEMGVVSGFRKLAKDGANLVRLWLFGSGEGFQWTDGVPSLAHNEIANIKDMLEGAQNWKMKVIPVLLDFRVGRLGGQYLDLITCPDKTTAYINNIIRPLVSACKGDRTVLAWDLINEPEHLFADGAGADQTQVRRFVARCAAAIHDIDPDAVVTVGSTSLKYNYQRRGDDAWDEREFLYSDEKLREAGAGDKLVEEGLGHLDLIQVHFYGGWKYDMWRDPLYNGDYSNKVAQGFDHTRNSKYNDVATRGDDPGFCRKPVLLGEVQSNIKGYEAYTANALADRAVQQGYSGLLFWSAFTQYTNTLEGTDGVGSWDDMREAISNHKSCKIFRATPF